MKEADWENLEGHPKLTTVRHLGIELRPGSQVRIWPKAGGDIMDLALKGRVATIESIEQDYDQKIHVAVVVNDDPGRDLGELRQPGHRFFYSLDELEPMELPDNQKL